jgi:hypothetical protein
VKLGRRQIRVGRNGTPELVITKITMRIIEPSRGHGEVLGRLSTSPNAAVTRRASIGQFSTPLL